MASWTSPWHCRVHAAYRAGSKLRAGMSREDGQHWERISTTAQSAAAAAGRRSKGESEQISSTPDAPGNAGVKTEGSGNKRPDKPGPCDRRPSHAGDPFCSPAASHWPRWFLGPWRCKLKTPSTGRSPCGTGFTSATVTSTATQTLDDVRTNGAPSREQCWLELQKVQQSIQSAPNKRRDSGRSSGFHFHFPTAMLEQMQERLHSIAQDTYRSWRRNCALFLGACAERRAEEKAPGAAAEARSGLQRITTQLHHTHHVRHLLPPSHHHVPFQQQHLSPHNPSQVWHRYSVCSHQSSARSK